MRHPNDDGGIVAASLDPPSEPHCAAIHGDAIVPAADLLAAVGSWADHLWRVLLWIRARRFAAGENAPEIVHIDSSGRTAPAFHWLGIVQRAEAMRVAFSRLDAFDLTEPTSRRPLAGGDWPHIVRGRIAASGACVLPHVVAAGIVDACMRRAVASIIASTMLTGIERDGIIATELLFGEHTNLPVDALAVHAGFRPHCHERIAWKLVLADGVHPHEPRAWAWQRHERDKIVRRCRRGPCCCLPEGY